MAGIVAAVASLPAAAFSAEAATRLARSIDSLTSASESAAICATIEDSCSAEAVADAAEATVVVLSARAAFAAEANAEASAPDEEDEEEEGEQDEDKDGERADATAVVCGDSSADDSTALCGRLPSAGPGAIATKSPSR